MKEVEINEVYMGYGIYGVPMHNENRYYIEFRDDGTYSLIYDGTHDDEDHEIDILYHADKNDLPDTVEEFSKPYEE